MPRTETPTARLKRLAADAAARSARARAKRRRLGQPDGRAVEIALGRAVADLLARAGALKPDGRFEGAALRAHPDLCAVVSVATDTLAETYVPEQVAAVLQMRLAA